MTRALRIVLGLALLGGLLWLLGARAAFAATYYVGCGGISGCTANNGGPGTAPLAPWGQYNEFLERINTGAIVGGDTVIYRPGRYAACDGNYWYGEHLRGGGTAGNPVTITIQAKQCASGADTGKTCSTSADCAGAAACTDLPGDVEIHGSARPGVCRAAGWNVAKKCDGSASPSSLIDAICEIDAHCGGVANSCDTVPGVYWANSESGGAWYGNSAGVAYQPSINPVGGDPKVYEILYSPSVNNAPIRMPRFTAGRDQVFTYATWGAAQRVDKTGQGDFTGYACRASRTPWFCCTGNGADAAPYTCNDTVPPRIYVQTASGADPGAVGDANFGPVEFPYMQFLLWSGYIGGTPSTAARYQTWTNNGNGKRWRFWWATRGILAMENAEGLVFEDFDFGYVSRTLPGAELTETDSANASDFPRYNQGDTYVVTGYFDQGANNVVRYLTFKRGKIHGSMGNEMFHLIGSSPGALDRFTDHLIEDVEFCDGPYAARVGESAGSCTGNANTNQVLKSWPPTVCVDGPTPGAYCTTDGACGAGGACQYDDWIGVMNTDGGAAGGWWGPLGGGANTDGAIISTARNQTFRGNYIHDTGLISFKESGGSGGLVFERNIVDMGRQYYTDAGYFPNVMLTYCDSPANCGGLTGLLSVGIPMRFKATNQRGAILRNNLFYNVQGWAIVGNCFSNDWQDLECASLNLPDPAYPPQIVNNTFHLVGDYRAASRKVCKYGSTFSDTLCTGDVNCPGGLCEYRNFPVSVIDLIGSRPGRFFTWATTGAKALVKNNLFFRQTPSLDTPPDPSRAGAAPYPRTPLISVESTLVPVTDFDRNLWADPTGVNALNTFRIGSTVYGSHAAWRTALRALNPTAEETSIVIDGETPLFKTPYTNLGLDTTAPGISAAYQAGIDLTSVGVPAFDLENTPRPPGRWSIGALQGEMTGSTATTSPTTTEPSTTAPTTPPPTTPPPTTPPPTTPPPTTPPPAGPGAPADWTADPATVAYWPFDTLVGGVTPNASASTTYCNPTTDGDMQVGNNPEQLSLSTTRVQGSHSLNNANSLGQIKQVTNYGLNHARDCLRSQSPDQWTVLGWWRQTGTPAYQYPQLIRNMDETLQNGWYLGLYQASGTIVGCVGPGDNSSECVESKKVTLTGANIDSQWHMIAFSFSGQGGRFSLGLDGTVAAAQGPTGISMTRNNVVAGYPFEQPHAPGSYGGIIGQQDATWWVDRVLTQQQVCRAYAVNADGSMGWCDGAAWAACTSDAQCGDRPGACNVALGQCVGRLSTSGAAECNTVAELGPCNVDLDGNAPTTPPSTVQGAYNLLRGAQLRGSVMR
jgi:hypothetical protein